MTPSVPRFARSRQVTLKTLVGRSVVIDVDQNDTLFCLKAYYADASGVPVSQQRVVFEQIQQNDDHALLYSDLGMRAGAEVFITLSLGGPPSALRHGFEVVVFFEKAKRLETLPAASKEPWPQPRMDYDSFDSGDDGDATSLLLHGSNDRSNPVTCSIMLDDPLHVAFDSYLADACPPGEHAGLYEWVGTKVVTRESLSTPNGGLKSLRPDATPRQLGLEKNSCIFVKFRPLSRDTRQRMEEDRRAADAGVVTAAAAAAAAAATAPLGLTATALADGGTPCEVSVTYVRACTAGFSAGRALGLPGAFGAVFRGVDAAQPVHFAVKRLSSTAPWPPERSAAREIELLSRFRHPNIIRLFGYTTDPAERCLLYELGENGALSDALVDDGRAAMLTWRVRLRIAAGVAAALAYLHRSGPTPAWHRDVKAANVVLTSVWEPKLIDCGISKLLTPDEASRAGGITATGALAFGTPGYMCPVYSKRHKYDDKAEVFSFGVLLCELLTGKLQLGGDGAGLDLVDEVVEEDGLAAHRDARAGAPLADDANFALEALAAQCVARRPAERPAMLALLRQLNALKTAHCAASAEEAMLAGELARVTAQRNALLAEKERAAAQRAPPRECCIFTACPDRALTLEDGLECAAGHFVCASCLAAAVEARGDAAGRLGCLACAAPPFADRDLLLRLPERSGLRYLSQVTRAAEAAAARTLEADFEARVGMAVEARLAQDGTATLRNQVIDEILTMRCPHAGCGRAMFYEQDDDTGERTLPWGRDCFSVMCRDADGNGCGAYFCGWCWMPFPQGAQGWEAVHTHVANCAHNTAPGRDLFGGPNALPLFEQALRQRQAAALDAFLVQLPPAQRGPLLASLARELADAGLPHAGGGAAPAAAHAAQRAAHEEAQARTRAANEAREAQERAAQRERRAAEERERRAEERMARDRRAAEELAARERAERERAAAERAAAERAARERAQAQRRQVRRGLSDSDSDDDGTAAGLLRGMRRLTGTMQRDMDRLGRFY
jgi:hypothetical protein